MCAYVEVNKIMQERIEHCDKASGHARARASAFIITRSEQAHLDDSAGTHERTNERVDVRTRADPKHTEQRQCIHLGQHFDHDVVVVCQRRNDDRKHRRVDVDSSFCVSPVRLVYDAVVKLRHGVDGALCVEHSKHVRVP
jgi:hypothetical protein